MNVNEVNPITARDREIADKVEITVDWADPRLAKVTRLRLLTDPGCDWFDVSYCHGLLHDGTPVRVGVPFDQLPRNGARRAIVHHAKREGVYAKQIGILDAISILF